ncbi:hypothetical protein [Halorientalis salina]|uniref:hypothetical protein n=1 Tax=Halorientalis salina TaxID=2932266 RepID=UPI0010ABB537|nr:hypothetical protein [Halorientalis salina]
MQFGHNCSEPHDSRGVPVQYGNWVVRVSPKAESTETASIGREGAEFGSKVIVVNTVLKVVFIGLALALLLAPL